MHAVAARSGFVTDAELSMAALQPLHEPMQRLRSAWYLAQEAHFAAAARPDSAIATDVILLCTSNPTNVVASMWPVSYA